MAVAPRKVFIPFQPLLEKITAWLKLSKPAYGFIDVAKHNVCVRVNRPNSRFGFLFYGGEADSAEESRERAAHKAVQRLISRFGVQVADFTYDRINMYKLCAWHYKHKCAELVQEKRGSCRPAGRVDSGTHSALDYADVSLDYTQFLGVVVRKTGAYATAVENTWVDGHGYIAWVVVSCPPTNMRKECIFSEPCVTAAIAQQKVAKRAVFYIACQYNLEIVDANYGTAAKVSEECSLVQKKYFILKAHLDCLGKQSRKSEPLVIAANAECVTPTDDATKIPVSEVPPPCPIKRTSVDNVYRPTALRIGTFEGLVADIPELETLFKKPKLD